MANTIYSFLPYYIDPPIPAQKTYTAENSESYTTNYIFNKKFYDDIKEYINNGWIVEEVNLKGQTIPYNLGNNTAVIPAEDLKVYCFKYSASSPIGFSFVSEAVDEHIIILFLDFEQQKIDSTKVRTYYWGTFNEQQTLYNINKDTTILLQPKITSGSNRIFYKDMFLTNYCRDTAYSLEYFRDNETDCFVNQTLLEEVDNTSKVLLTPLYLDDYEEEDFKGLFFENYGNIYNQIITYHGENFLFLPCHYNPTVPNGTHTIVISSKALGSV